MALKADPPDFIDSGSYGITDVGKWGGQGVSLAVGLMLFLPFIMIGIAQGKNLSNVLGSAFGVNTGGGTDSIEVV